MSAKKGKDVVGLICKGLQTESIGRCDTIIGTEGGHKRMLTDSAKDQLRTRWDQGKGDLFESVGFLYP
jgi:hypothetical protein